MSEIPFDVNLLAGVHPHCMDQARKRIPFFRDLSVQQIQNRIEQAVRCAARLDLVYANPRQDGQYLAYAQFSGRDVWFVLGENRLGKPGEWSIITILVHKPQHFEEYLIDVENTLGSAA